MIPHTVDVWRASGKSMIIDLDEPISDVPLDGHDHLYITALSCGVPLGSVVIPAPIDPFPGELIADRLTHLAGLMHRQRLKSRLMPPQQSRPRSLSASVVIATRGRPEHLRRCLTSIRKLDPPPLEVLVVENGSHDDETREVIESAGATYLHEPLPGKSRALNRGLTVARGDVVLLTDDDVAVDRSWAAELLACFDDELVMAASGLVLAARLDTPAHWLCERFSLLHRGFSARVLDGTRCSPLDAPTVCLGGSMAVRRGFLLSIGGFPEELGPGMPMSAAGEEGYVGYRALREGFKIAYRTSALAWHLHRPDLKSVRTAARDYAASCITFSLHMMRDNRDVVGIAGFVRTLRDLWRLLPLPFGSHPQPRTFGFVLYGLWGVLRGPISYVRSRRIVRRREPLVRPAEEPAPWLEDPPGPPVSVPDGVVLPTISVVIATCGKGKSLLPLLRELEAQDYPAERVEVIVSVAGHVDGLREEIAGAGLRYTPNIVTGEPAGTATSRNQAAATATGEILLFFDDDVSPRNDRVLLAHAAEHVAGVRGAVIGPVLPDGKPRRQRAAQVDRNWWIEHARRLREDRRRVFTDVVGGNLSLPRSLFVEHEGFFTAMSSGEDWELGYRLLSAGVPIRTAPAASVVRESSQKAPGQLADRRRQGASYVAFVRRHPSAYWSLPLVRWETIGRRGRRVIRFLIRAGARRRVSKWVVRSLRAAEHMQKRLERAGLLNRSERLSRRLSLLSLWAGAGEAVGDDAEWAALVSRAKRHRKRPVELDLSEPRWEEIDARSPEAVVTFRGAVLGHAPLSWGGVPWDRDEFARLVTDQYGWQAMVAELSG